MSILLASTAIRSFGMDLCHLKVWFFIRLGFFMARRSDDHE